MSQQKKRPAATAIADEPVSNQPITESQNMQRNTTTAPAAPPPPNHLGDVIIPERRLAAIDAMDEALEMARTCSYALEMPENGLGAGELESIAYTLNTAISLFGKVRHAINEAHGRS